MNNTFWLWNNPWLRNDLFWLKNNSFWLWNSLLTRLTQLSSYPSKVKQRWHQRVDPVAFVAIIPGMGID